MVFSPALNEELAARRFRNPTAGRGARPRPRRRGRLLVRQEPGARPGRRCHPSRQLPEPAPLGGAVALIGDDPTCKSSTFPSSSVSMATSLHVPLLSRRLGRRRGAPRASRRRPLPATPGLWAGSADRGRRRRRGRHVVDLVAAWPRSPLPTRPGQPAPHCSSDPAPWRPRKTLSRSGLPRALEYAQLTSLNAVTVTHPGPAWASWPPATPTPSPAGARGHGPRRPRPAPLGVRLIRICLPWPLDAAELRAIDRGGLEEVVVIEDKAAFLESQVKEALYGKARSPWSWATRSRGSPPGPGYRVGGPATPSSGCSRRGSGRPASRRGRERIEAVTRPAPPGAAPRPSPGPHAAPFARGVPTTSRPEPTTTNW